jgi:glutathione S-transferase
VGYDRDRRVLNDLFPEAELLPRDRAASAYCRSICGEMHSGFVNLRSALPMNLKAHHPGFHVYPAAGGPIARITEIWRECLDRLRRTVSLRRALDGRRDVRARRDALRDLRRDARRRVRRLRGAILALPEMLEWMAAALAEPDEVEELDAEF